MADRFGPGLLDQLTSTVVGRRRELEAAVAALAARRHLLIEGPPGTGKSTLLRAIARGSGSPFVFVEGNAELTPARLVGSFDPAAVINEGYNPDSFVAGPLIRALGEGSLLYLEEINRIPEETLNVLITVMSEGELHVPRLGMVAAAPEFRLVAAMNPYDAIGTARIASAVYDRCCRLAMSYQSLSEEIGIVASTLATEQPAHISTKFSEKFLRAVVELVRSTREHPEIRTGSSVRGAIDLVLLLTPLAELRREVVDEPSVTLDAALLALSGRIRIHESSSRGAEEILTELWHQHLDGVPSYEVDLADGSESVRDPGSTDGSELPETPEPMATASSRRGKVSPRPAG